MTLSTKPEVHNISHRHQKTEPTTVTQSDVTLNSPIMKNPPPPSCQNLLSLFLLLPFKLYERDDDDDDDLM